MTKNHKTVKEILAYIKQDKPGYIRLMDAEQNTLVPYNTKKGATVETLKQIEKILTAPAASLHPDGFYFLSIKSTQTGKHTLHRIAKGNVKEEPAAPATIVVSAPAPKENFSETGLSLLQNQLEQLKLENELLKEQLESELEEEEEAVRISEERIDKWVDRAEKIVIPALDKFWELQERKLAIREKEIALGAKAPAGKTVAFNPKAQGALNIIHKFTGVRPDTVQPAPAAPAAATAPAAPEAPAQPEADEMTAEEQQAMEMMQQADAGQIIEVLRQLKKSPEQYAEFANTVLMFRDDAGEILVKV
jgi:hypothetical protein